MSALDKPLHSWAPPPGFFQTPRASQQSSAVNKTASSAMGGQMVFIKNSTGVRIGNSVSFDLTAMTKKKKNKGKVKIKELVDELNIKEKEQVESVAAPSQSQMRP